MVLPYNSYAIAVFLAIPCGLTPMNRPDVSQDGDLAFVCEPSFRHVGPPTLHIPERIPASEVKGAAARRT